MFGYLFHIRPVNMSPELNYVEPFGNLDKADVSAESSRDRVSLGRCAIKKTVFPCSLVCMYVLNWFVLELSLYWHDLGLQCSSLSLILEWRTWSLVEGIWEAGEPKKECWWDKNPGERDACSLFFLLSAGIWVFIMQLEISWLWGTGDKLGFFLPV